MKVLFQDIYKCIYQKKILEKKILQMLRSNKFVGGIEVAKFENKFSKFLNAKYCTSVANGTDALEIALETLNIKKNSEIIVPVNTWISTAAIVVRGGYKLVFCDISLKDYSICLKDLKKKINKRTKVIIPVHLFGFPADMIGIKKIIGKKNIKIIEDCAQAHGAKIKKKFVGTFGDIGAFSFYPGKNLGALGDAGCIITNNKNIEITSKRIRNHGALVKYDHKLIGRNSRLDTIHCEALSLKLKNYAKVLQKRKKLAHIYMNELKEIKEINLPVPRKQTECVFHQFVIRTKKRDKLINYLKKKNIQTMIHYPYMLSELKIFKKAKGFSSLVNSKNLGKKLLSLPISEEHSEKEILYIAKHIKFFFNRTSNNINNFFEKKL